MTDDEFAAYLAEVSHGLRTPLAAVRGFTDLLIRAGDGITPDKRDDYLARIAEAGARLEELVRRIETWQPRA